MKKKIELQKDYISYDRKIFKGSKFKILHETENGYKLEYLGINKDFDTKIFYLNKHWFHIPIENKKEFILPKKWCINMEDYKKGCVVANYIKPDHWYLKSPIKVKYFYFIGNKFDVWSKKKEKGFTEITFEEFEKYVLKKNIEANNVEKSKGINLSLNDIIYKLSKHYDKEDVNEIIKVITK